MTGVLLAVFLFSSVLGTSLIGGLVTANPLVSLGIFAGTVLTSVGSIIVLTKRDKDRLAELDRAVTGIMLGLEQEFEKCHSKLASLESDCHNIDQLTTQLRAASIGRDMAGAGGSNLDLVTNLIGNIHTFSRGLRSRSVLSVETETSRNKSVCLSGLMNCRLMSAFY